MRARAVPRSLCVWNASISVSGFHISPLGISHEMLQGETGAACHVGLASKT